MLENVSIALSFRPSALPMTIVPMAWVNMEPNRIQSGDTTVIVYAKVLHAAWLGFALSLGYSTRPIRDVSAFSVPRETSP